MTKQSPLRGVRILVTRPQRQVSSFVERLRELEAQTIELPLIEIAPLFDPMPLDEALARPYDWIVFTSANAVHAVFERRRAFASSPRIIAIGPSTAEALAEHGARVDWIPDEQLSDAIVDGIGDVRGKRILLPRSDLARKELADGLRARGAIVDDIAAYRTIAVAGVAQQLDDILEKGIDVVTFFSASAVRAFASSIDPRRLEGVIVACIGPVTAEAARHAGSSVDVIATEATSDSLADAIVRHMKATV